MGKPLEQSFEEKPQWVLVEILDDTVGACMDVETVLEELRDARKDLKIKEVIKILSDLSITAQHLMRTADSAEDRINKEFLIVEDFINE